MCVGVCFYVCVFVGCFTSKFYSGKAKRLLCLPRGHSALGCVFNSVCVWLCVCIVLVFVIIIVGLGVCFVFD